MILHFNTPFLLEVTQQSYYSISMSVSIAKFSKHGLKIQTNVCLEHIPLYQGVQGLSPWRCIESPETCIYAGCGAFLRRKTGLSGKIDFPLKIPYRWDMHP